jgi:hypothetical protein
MPATLYTTLAPTLDAVNKYQQNDTMPSGVVAPYTVDYMGPDVMNTFSTIFTPKIYGSTLDALEIASSGKIAATLNDAHAFDISEASKLVTFVARNSNAFQFGTQLGEAYIKLDNVLARSTLYAKSNVSITASNADLTMVSGANTIITAAADASLTSTFSNVNISALTKNIVADAKLNFSLHAGSNGYVAADSNLYISASNLMALTSDQLSFNIASTFAVSTSNIELTASNDFTAIAGHLFTAAASNNMSLSTASNMTLYAGSNMTETAVNDMKAYAGRDWGLAAARDITAAASNQVTLQALSNMALSATSQDVTITAGRSILETAGSNVSITAASNITSAAGLNMTSTAGASMTLQSATAMLLDSTTSVEIDAGTGITMLALNGSDISMSASNNVIFAASNNVNISALQDIISTAGHDAKSFITHDMLLQVGAAATLTAASASMTASNGFTLTSSTSNIALSAGLDIVSAAARDVATSAGSNMTATAVGTYALQAASLALTSTSSNILIASGSNLTYTVPATCSHTFDVGSVHVMTLRPLTDAEKASGSNNTNHKLVINADFDVLGVVNSTSVQQTVLEVQDKIIHLAYNSNLDAPYDGAGNEGAGIVIDGIPAGQAATQEMVDKYEKSIRWHKSTSGMEALGTAGDPTSEAYWEVKGGALRITQQISGDNVKFCFRINSRKELELWKSDDYATSANGTPFACKRVAAFGRVM